MECYIEDRYGGTITCDVNNITLQDANAINVEGYCIYDLCGHNADYIIMTNLTKEQAYSEFNESKDNMFTTVIYIIKDNKIIEKGGTMYD